MMYTSFALFAMAGLVTNNAILPWELDYRAARQLSEKKQRPLAVFLGSGAVNWQQITREGAYDAEVQKLLLQQYIRVYVDVKTDYGRKLAEMFGLNEDHGLFISDRTGGYMAFRHDGTASAKDLVRHLNRYSDPDHIVVTTETDRRTLIAPMTTANYQNIFGQQCLT
jgi:hypothetical protein